MVFLPPEHNQLNRKRMPTDNIETKETKYPLLLYLHGAGEMRGELSDIISEADIENHRDQKEEKENVRRCEDKKGSCFFLLLRCEDVQCSNAFAKIISAVHCLHTISFLLPASTSAIATTYMPKHSLSSGPLLLDWRCSTNSRKEGSISSSSFML